MLNKIKVIGLIMLIISGIMMVGCNGESFLNDVKQGFEDAQ